MKIKPEHITEWLKEVVPHMPAILKAAAFVVLAWKAPETAISISGLASLAKHLRPDFAVSTQLDSDLSRRH